MSERDLPCLRVTRHGPSYMPMRADAADRQDPRLLEKAGFTGVFAENTWTTCAAASRSPPGATEQAAAGQQELLDALLKASRGGLDPIYCDTSPCTLRLVQEGLDPRLRL